MSSYSHPQQNHCVTVPQSLRVVKQRQYYLFHKIPVKYERDKLNKSVTHTWCYEKKKIAFRLLKIWQRVRIKIILKSIYFQVFTGVSST